MKGKGPPKASVTSGGKMGISDRALETPLPERQLKATVVVPVFNTEPYLQRCIESLLGQTRKDFEIVIVDDSSGGNTESIVSQFQSAQPEIKYVRHPTNRGVLCARFTGVDHSSGSYVGFLDSDDIARPHYVERLMAAVLETGGDIIGSAKNEKTKGPRFAIEGAEALLEAYADKRIPNWAVWTKFYRKDLVLSLSDLRGFANAEKLIKANDLVFNIFCALRGPRYVNIPDALVQYTRGRVGSATNPNSSELRRESFQSAVRAYEIIREAASGFEESIDQIVFLSAKNTYKSTLVGGDDVDLAWARASLTGSPVGGLVMGAMLEAADRERRLLARKRSLHEAKIHELRQKLFQARGSRDELSGKLTAGRTKLADMKQILNDERNRRQRLRAIVADLLHWTRKALGA